MQRPCGRQSLLSRPSPGSGPLREEASSAFSSWPFEPPPATGVFPAEATEIVELSRAIPLGFGQIPNPLNL